MMKAGIKVEKGAGNFQVAETEKPVVGDTDVLVRIEASGVCGSDVLLYEWLYRGRFPVEPPVILGHEGAGVIVEIGRNVKTLKPGDRVVVESILGCGDCYYCRHNLPNLCPHWEHLGITRNGTFAEYIRMPMGRVHILPEEVSFEEGALIEPLGIVVNAFDRIRFNLGDTVAVIGPGALGLLFIQAARSFGASKIVSLGLEKDASRLITAESMGADRTIITDNPEAIEEVFEITDGLGADIVVEAGGSPESFELAAKLGRGRSQIVAMGYAPAGRIEPVHFARQEMAMFGIVACGPIHYERALTWLRYKKVSPAAIISHRMSLDEAEEGIRLMRDKEASKVCLYA